MGLSCGISMSVIDDSRCTDDTNRVVRMMIINDATSRSVTYDYHSDNSRAVIYDCNILVRAYEKKFLCYQAQGTLTEVDG